jgi:modulator of FtsH protease HflK
VNDLIRILRAADGPTGGGGPPGRSRPTGVTLRSGNSTGNDSELLDPANQSLADALRITLRLIQAGMLVLAGLFVVSGSQSVQENERGIRLLFGAISKSDVEPGLSLSPPYPVGELIRVDIGQAELKLDREFWVFAASESDLTKPIDMLTKMPNLTPGQGGSNLTADGNLAHTQWKILYSRDNHAQWAQNVLPEMERDLVKSAVKRGVVQACAKVNIDELLRQTGGDLGSVAAKAKAIAQAQLDRVKSGIRLQQVLLENVTPPLWVRERFNAVQGSVSDATKQMALAESTAQTLLTSLAGDSVEPLRKLLDEYEVAIEGRGTRKPEEILNQINTMMSGEPIQVDGAAVPGIQSGVVASIVSEAKQYRSEVTTRRRSEYERYAQKLAQYKINPRLTLANEVADSVRGFLSRQDVQVMLVPDGVKSIDLALNRDPEIMKEIIRDIKKREADRAAVDRMNALMTERHRPKDSTTVSQ